MRSFAPESSGTLSWSAVKDILALDNRDRLEREVVKHGNRLENIINPTHAPKSQTIFHATVQLRSTNCLKFLLKKTINKIQFNIPDENGSTPLHLAVLNMAQEYNSPTLGCLKLLLSHGAFVNGRNNDGDTPLHLMAKMMLNGELKNWDGTIACFHILLTHEFINVHAQNKCRQSAKSIVSLSLLKGTVYHAQVRISLIEKAISTNSTSNLEEIYEQIADCLLSVNSINAKQILTTQLKNSKLLGNLSNRYIGNKTLLYYIVEKFDLKLIDGFIRIGCDPWLANVGDGKIPLHAALSRCDFDVVALILQHMKKRNCINHQLDLKELSFSLLQTFLCSSKAKNKSQMKCLERLLKDDILLDVNQFWRVNSRTKKISSALTTAMVKFAGHLTAFIIATWMDNSAAIQLLQRSGAQLIEVPRQTGENFNKQYDFYVSL